MKPVVRLIRAAIRIMHWIMLLCYGLHDLLSGWEIYNASPSLPFLFLRGAGLGGWLGGARSLAPERHVVAALADGIAYLIYGFVSGHFSRDSEAATSPLRWDTTWAPRCAFAWGYRMKDHNAVQRVLYAGVIVVIILQVPGTGLAIWKPVQLGWLVRTVRRLSDSPRHSSPPSCSASLPSFSVHVALVAIHPRTLKSMIVAVPAETGESQ